MRHYTSSMAIRAAKKANHGQPASQFLEQAHRRREKIAPRGGKIAEHAEMMPSRDEQRPPHCVRMTLRPPLPQEPGLTNELVGLVGAGRQHKWRLRARRDVNRADRVRPAAVQPQIDVERDLYQRLQIEDSAYRQT